MIILLLGLLPHIRVSILLSALPYICIHALLASRGNLHVAAIVRLLMMLPIVSVQGYAHEQKAHDLV